MQLPESFSLSKSEWGWGVCSVVVCLFVCLVCVCVCVFNRPNEVIFFISKSWETYPVNKRVMSILEKGEIFNNNLGFA